MGSATFQKNARSNARDVAGRVQPFTAHERPVEDEQWLVRELPDVDRAPIITLVQ